MSSQPTPKIRIAYIILTHKYPQLLTRLVSRLNGENAAFYIHIDKKVDISPFQKAFQETRLSNLFFVRREKCYWGDFGIVQATLNAFNLIRKQAREYDYVSLLSGQDYPIKSNPFIADFLDRNFGKIFMTHTPMPVRIWKWEEDGGMGRLDKYYYRFRGELRVYPPMKEPLRLRSKIFHRFLSLYFALPRRFPPNLHPYAGSTWWTIPLYAVKYILDYLDQRPDVLRYFRHVRLPDEIFFQTLLCNSPDPAIRDNLVHNELRFIDWSQKDLLGGHPVILTKNHLDALRSSPDLYARKFDPEVDETVMDWIDQELLFHQEWSGKQPLERT